MQEHQAPLQIQQDKYIQIQITENQRGYFFLLAKFYF